MLPSIHLSNIPFSPSGTHHHEKKRLLVKHTLREKKQEMPVTPCTHGSQTFRDVGKKISFSLSLCQDQDQMLNGRQWLQGYSLMDLVAGGMEREAKQKTRIELFICYFKK